MEWGPAVVLKAASQIFPLERKTCRTRNWEIMGQDLRRIRISVKGQDGAPRRSPRMDSPACPNSIFKWSSRGFVLCLSNIGPFTCFSLLSADAVPETQQEMYKFQLFCQKKPWQEEQKVFPLSSKCTKAATVLGQEVALTSATLKDT